MIGFDDAGTAATVPRQTITVVARLRGIQVDLTVAASGAGSN
jgi:hypothetical protein